MTKKHFLSLGLILCLVFQLTACYSIPLSNNPINYETMSGDFIKTKSDTITREYRIRVTNGFSALIDFDIDMGQVDWEIIDPEGDIVFSGYVINENGSTFRQLTKPSSYHSGRFGEKEVVNDGADFSYLQLESNSSSGIYKLKLKPKAAEGSYKVVWSDRLAKK